MLTGISEEAFFSIILLNILDQFEELIFIAFGLIMIVYIVQLIKSFRKISESVNWSQTIVDFNCSSKEFYKRFEENVRDQSIPVKSRYSQKRFLKSVAGMSGATYLRISCKYYDCYFGAITMGQHFFFSQWTTLKTPLRLKILRSIPLIGRSLYMINLHKNPYQIDYWQSYMDILRTSFLDTIDDVLKENELPLLTDDVKKPLLIPK